MKEKKLMPSAYTPGSITGTGATSLTSDYNSYTTGPLSDVVKNTDPISPFDIGGLAKDITSKPGSAALKDEVMQAAINLEKLFEELDLIRQALAKKQALLEKERTAAKAKAKKEAKVLANRRKLEIAAMDARHFDSVTNRIKLMSDSKLKEALISFFEWEENREELMYSEGFKKKTTNLFSIGIDAIAKLGNKLECSEDGFDKGYEYKGYEFKHFNGSDGFWRVNDSKSILFESV